MEEKKYKNCAICTGTPMGMSPEGWNNLQAWHDNGHPDNQVRVTTTGTFLPPKPNTTEEWEKKFYETWRDFWTEESQNTEQTYLTADTIGIIKDFVIKAISSTKQEEIQRIIELAEKMKSKDYYSPNFLTRITQGEMEDHLLINDLITTLKDYGK